MNGLIVLIENGIYENQAEDTQNGYRLNNLNKIITCQQIGYYVAPNFTTAAKVVFNENVFAMSWTVKT
tara:strand:- start:409 stop:612 length:204 start_codon:yes stop_codon:yes gene_type:complete